MGGVSGGGLAPLGGVTVRDSRGPRGNILCCCLHFCHGGGRRMSRAEIWG